MNKIRHLKRNAEKGKCDGSQNIIVLLFYTQLLKNIGIQIKNDNWNLLRYRPCHKDLESQRVK